MGTTLVKYFAAFCKLAQPAKQNRHAASGLRVLDAALLRKLW